MTASFSGWRCVNKPHTYSGGAPYFTVACTASHRRSLSFKFQNT